MLSENIKNLRTSKGLSQQELATQLNIVRQTLSKWENGLSVPDADMLIRLSNTFEVPVSSLLGETISEKEANTIQSLANKLEIINLQLAQRKESRQKNPAFFFNRMQCGHHHWISDHGCFRKFLSHVGFNGYGNIDLGLFST